MPIYKFFCDFCNKDFEIITKMGQKYEICPDCGNYTEDKQVTAPGGFDIKGYSAGNGYSKEK